MLFDAQMARRLEALINPDVEKALFLLLDEALRQAEEQTYGNPAATDAELRQFQGKRAIIKELKEYRIRLSDGIKREKYAAESSN